MTDRSVSGLRWLRIAPMLHLKSSLLPPMQMMPVGELPTLVHEVEDGHRHAREDQGSDLAGHQRDGQPLEDWIEEDHRGPHHHGGGGEHHGAEAHRPGVNHRLVQGHPLGDAQLDEIHQDDGVSHHDPGPGDETDHAGGGEKGAHGPMGRQNPDQ